MRVCAGRTQGTHVQNGLVQVLLQLHGSFHGILSSTPLILGRSLLHPGTECVHPTGFAALRDAQRPHASRPPAVGRSGPHPPEPQHHWRNRRPETGRYRRPTDAVWPGSGREPPTRWNDYDDFGSSWFFSKVAGLGGLGWLR